MEKFKEHMQDWCKTHKAEFYFDYRDELLDDHISAIVKAATLETKEKRQEALWDVYNDIQENCIDWQFEIERGMFQSCLDDFDGDKPEDEDGDLFDLFRMDYLQWQGDLLESLANNTRDARVVAYPVIDGERLDADAAAELLGCSAEDMAPTYSSEVLCVCGSLDIGDIIKNIKEGKRLEKITIKPSDETQLLLHCGFNGSGNMGKIQPTKTITIAADFVHDAPRKYGVDAVYGFTSRFWDESLDVVWE